MSTLKPLKIDIVSDVVCPWCYIGKRRIENALAQVSGCLRETRKMVSSAKELFRRRYGDETFRVKTAAI